MAVTKNILQVRDYQVWTSANMVDGDILGVYESLGRRCADTVTLESAGGASRVRFNVARTTYREQGAVYSGTYHGNSPNGPWSQALFHNVHNNFAGLGAGGSRSPELVYEHEDDQQPDIIVANGTTQTWTRTEIAVNDIKIVNASGLRVTVT